MTRILFVTNGHGEAAIADRIALELRGIAPEAVLEHFALVESRRSETLKDVGPRRPMPSGGLIAMGNARNLFADLRAGLVGLTLAQISFLRRARGVYDVVVAVGDAFALTMALRARARTVFVGSAKSVEVAPYGAFEERTLSRAAACFVRDEATAEMLRRHGIEAEVANAIVDLFATPDDPAAQRAVNGFAPAIAIFPGSRESAYGDALFLVAVVAALAEDRPALGAALSIAAGLDAGRFADDLRRAGFDVTAVSRSALPFAIRRDGRELVRAWCGDLGPLLARVELVLGQAGTANEAAAAAGVPVIAFERDRHRKTRWYRQRQRGLLGEALAVLPADAGTAVVGVRAILDDSDRRRRMGAVGRERMGAAGGAARIARRIAAVSSQS